ARDPKPPYDEQRVGFDSASPLLHDPLDLQGTDHAAEGREVVGIGGVAGLGNGACELDRVGDAAGGAIVVPLQYGSAITERVINAVVVAEPVIDDVLVRRLRRIAGLLLRDRVDLGILVVGCWVHLASPS